MVKKNLDSKFIDNICKYGEKNWLNHVLFRFRLRFLHTTSLKSKKVLKRTNEKKTRKTPQQTLIYYVLLVSSNPLLTHHIDWLLKYFSCYMTKGKMKFILIIIDEMIEIEKWKQKSWQKIPRFNSTRTKRRNETTNKNLTINNFRCRRCCYCYEWLNLL